MLTGHFTGAPNPHQGVRRTSMMRGFWWSSRAMPWIWKGRRRHWYWWFQSKAPGVREEVFFLPGPDRTYEPVFHVPGLVQKRTRSSQNPAW